LPSINGRSNSRPSTFGRHPAGCQLVMSWDVDVCLTSGRMVTERAVASGPREAVEATLARLALRPEQVGGVAAERCGDGPAH
jgi:hypothetical protein